LAIDQEVHGIAKWNTQGRIEISELGFGRVRIGFGELGPEGHQVLLVALVLFG